MATTNDFRHFQIKQYCTSIENICTKFNLSGFRNKQEYGVIFLYNMPQKIKILMNKYMYSFPDGLFVHDKQQINTIELILYEDFENNFKFLSP